MKLLTLRELIDEKAFPTSTQLSAPLVIRVDDIVEWLFLKRESQEAKISKSQIIDVLLATMSMSEGVTADAIIAVLNATAQDSQS